MHTFLPKIEISLAKIQQNAQILSERYGQAGISLMGVSKAVLGNVAIAEAMIRGGVQFIADSRLENLQRLHQAGLSTQLVLLRTALSQAEAVIPLVDISLNTEFVTIQALAHYAKLQNKIHAIILMVELGDLREGILPADLGPFIHQVLELPQIKLVGLGCNLACYGGIKPTLQKMNELSNLTEAMEQAFRIPLKIISGGNSANHQWYEATRSPQLVASMAPKSPATGRINNLRIGESILLGRETVDRQAIPGLSTTAFQLVAEVIEFKNKPSLPKGESCQNAFGDMPLFRDRGIHHRAILALGRQDVLISGLSPCQDLEILGASSDHLVLDSKAEDLAVGSQVKFNLDYGGLLAAMTSPYVHKQLI